MSGDQQNSESFIDTIIGFAILAVLGFGGWITWPVSLWLAGAAITYFCINWIIAKLAQRRALISYDEFGEPRYSAKPPSIFESTLRAINGAVFYVGAGIALVALSQAFLYGTGQLVEPETVLKTEEFLSNVYQRLSAILSFEVLLITLGLFFVLALIFPKTDAVGQLIESRRFLSNFLLVLLGATSFTFFSALDLNHHDPEWRKSERYQARAQLRKIADERRKIIGATWLEAEVKNLSQKEIQSYKIFFRQAARSPFATNIARQMAKNLGAAAPKQTIATNKELIPERQVAPERIRNYLHGNPPIYEQPSLSELRKFNIEMKAESTRLSALRKATITLATNAFAELIPAVNKTHIQAFVSEASASVARSALNKIVPPAIASESVLAARGWVTEHLSLPRSANASASPKRWNVAVSAVQRIPSGIAADAAIAALVARMHTQSLNRQKLLRNFDYSKIRTGTSPKVRFRR